MRPPWPELRATPAERAACRATLRQGSRTFFAASLLLPRGVREPACALYAFCRLADDAVDLDGVGSHGLERLRERLERVYAGRPSPGGVDRALAEVLARFAIPRALPEALIEGLEWDAAERRYEDLAALEGYAARVAGSVGAMMALVMGVRTPDAAARACELGMAMQLSNIARDVGEDARAGRVYLPLAWLREAGIDADVWLAEPLFSDALGDVVRRVVRAADRLYTRAEPGIAWLPPSCRPGIRGARLLYAAIGHELERRGLDSVSRRTVVPPGRKARLLARALVPLPRPALPAPPAPPPEAARFLVEAVAAAPAPAPRTSALGWSLDQRIAWLVELFERLERRDRMLATGAPGSVPCAAPARGRS